MPHEALRLPVLIEHILRAGHFHGNNCVDKKHNLGSPGTLSKNSHFLT